MTNMVSKQALLLTCLILLGTCFLPFANEDQQGNDSKPCEELQEIPKLALGFFTKNDGQLENQDILFTYTSQDHVFGFARNSIWVKVLGTESGNKSSCSVFKILFQNSNPVDPHPGEELGHTTNFFTDDNQANWRSGVPNYNEIIYEELYDGIDLVYYTTPKGLKYDWVVKPFADPNQIRECFEDPTELTVNRDGGLRIQTEAGYLLEEAPFSYQDLETERQEVTVAFQCSGNIVSYDLGEYDPSRELIIDPLVYSSFIGTSHVDRGFDIAVDSQGDIYLTGESTSPDFPTTTGAFDEVYSDGGDVIILKLRYDQEGTELLYCTFAGSGGVDAGFAISVDEDGCAYVAGATQSYYFPTTTGCFDDSYNGSWDVFVLKLNADGSDLVYSTFIGGDDNDFEQGWLDISLDRRNRAVVVGSTRSTDFPTTPGCFMEELQDHVDVFVAKLNEDGSDLHFSTFLGGEHLDYGYAVASDSPGNSFITGYTMSDDFPTTPGALKRTRESEDVFVTKLNPSGSELVYSTFVGGSSSDSAYGITVDNNGVAIITGNTYSSDFPTTAGAFDRDYADEWDAFVFKLNSDGDQLLASTYLGGAEYDQGFSVALDSNENICVGGQTVSNNFPTTSDAYDNSHNGGTYDIFVSKLDPGLTRLIYSTFIGGSDDDGEYQLGIDVDSSDKIYIAGITKSSGFPTTPNAYDGTHNGDEDVVLCVLSDPKPTAYIDSISPALALATETVEFLGHATDNGTIETYVWRSSRDGELYNGSEKGFQQSDLSLGNHNIYLKVEDDQGLWSEEVLAPLVVHEKPKATIYEVSPGLALDTDIIHFRGHGTDDGSIVRYVWHSDLDGEFYNDSTPDTDFGELSNGRHTIAFSVQDDNEAWSDPKTTHLTVTSRPRADIDSVAPKTAPEGETVWFYGNGSDDDGTIESYQWRSDLDGTLESSKSFSTFALSAGTHTITFLVEDNYGVWSEEVSTSLIITPIPEAVIDLIIPSHVNEMETLAFFGNGSSDYPIEEYRWHSSIDGLLSKQNRFSLSNLSNGTHTITFSVRDSTGSWSTEVSQTITVNGLPIVSIREIEPRQAKEGETVWFSGEVIDDEVIERYEWTSNIDGFLSHESSFNHQQLSAGTHVISLRAKDGSGVWSELDETSLEILKMIPVASIVSLGPNPAIHGESIELKGEGEALGSITRYMWYSSIDGEFYNGTRRSFTTTELSPGDHTITLRVRDNNGVWSTEISTTLRVEEKSRDDDNSSGFFWLGITVVVGLMFLGVIAVLKLNIIATDESSYEEEENLMDDTGQIEDNEGEAQSFGDEYEEPQDQHLDEEILPPLKEEPLEEDEIIAPIDEDSDDDILPPIIE